MPSMTQGRPASSREVGARPSGPLGPGVILALGVGRHLGAAVRLAPSPSASAPRPSPDEFELWPWSARPSGAAAGGAARGAAAGAAAAGAARAAVVASLPVASYPVAPRPCDARRDVPPGYVVTTPVVEGPGIRPTRAHRYALPEAAALFQAIGRLWAARHPGRAKLHLGDVSQLGGGQLRPHVSHRIGVDADIALPRRDGGMGGTAVGQPSYDQAATRDLLRVIRDVAGARLCFLFFNDPQLIAEGLCRHSPGHHNHVHVRFKLPARVASPSSPPGPSAPPTPASPSAPPVPPAPSAPPAGAGSPGGGAAALLAAIQAVAARLGVDPLLLRALVQVESAGSGFGPAGRPLVRVEAHRLLREPEPLRSRFAARFRVGGPKPWQGHLFRDTAGAWAAYHGKQDREWQAFEAARAVDADAAVRATSWGFGQVMGEWQALGYPSALAFADLQGTIGGQVETFGRFLQHKRGMVAALRARDFRAIATLYNGAGKVDDYSARIRDAWVRLGGR